MVGAILEQASSIDFGPEELVIHLDAALAPPLERRECLEVVGRCAEQIVGRSFRVRVDSSPGDQGPVPAPPKASPAAPQPPEPRAKPAELTPPDTDPGIAGQAADENGNLMEQAKRDPGVRQLLKEFGAQVIEVKPWSEGPPDKPSEDHP